MAGPDGVARRGSTIRRAPVDSRWSPSRFWKVAVVPSQANGALPQELEPIVVVSAPEGEIDRPQRQRRTFSIMFQGLMDHGRGCSKRNAFTNGRSVGTVCSSVCPCRFAEMFEATGGMRVFRSRDRGREVREPDTAEAQEEVDPSLVPEVGLWLQSRH